jgi:YtcA family
MMPRARVNSRPQSENSLSLCLALAMLTGLTGCDGSPSRSILGSYFPSWMVCALVGIAIAGVARMIFKSSGLLQELPVPFVVLLAIGCATTFSLWLLWLA